MAVLRIERGQCHRDEVKHITYEKGLEDFGLQHRSAHVCDEAREGGAV